MCESSAFSHCVFFFGDVDLFTERGVTHTHDVVVLVKLRQDAHDWRGHRRRRMHLCHHDIEQWFSNCVLVDCTDTFERKTFPVFHGAYQTVVSVL